VVVRAVAVVLELGLELLERQIKDLRVVTHPALAQLFTLPQVVVVLVL
jgi:hypothetical protein